MLSCLACALSLYVQTLMPSGNCLSENAIICQYLMKYTRIQHYSMASRRVYCCTQWPKEYTAGSSTLWGPLVGCAWPVLSVWWSTLLDPVPCGRVAVLQHMPLCHPWTLAHSIVYHSVDVLMFTGMPVGYITGLVPAHSALCPMLPQVLHD